MFRACELKSRINPVHTEEGEEAAGVEALAEVCTFPLVEEGGELERTLWEGWGHAQPPSGAGWGGVTNEGVSEAAVADTEPSSQTSKQ